MTVYEGQTGLILKFGKYSRAVDPGLTRVNPYVSFKMTSNNQIEREIATSRHQNHSR
jgi:regulator of protease activity HflC (stomatin/prohibitin superfamily)